MNDGILAISLVLATINLTAFITMWIDKAKSANPLAWRIPESRLFFMAAAFGSLGVYAGMFAFRHKTRKWPFLLGIPLLILQNAAVAYLAYLYLSGKIL